MSLGNIRDEGVLDHVMAKLLPVVLPVVTSLRAQSAQPANEQHTTPASFIRTEAFTPAEKNETQWRFHKVKTAGRIKTKFPMKYDKFMLHTCIHFMSHLNTDIQAKKNKSIYDKNWTKQWYRRSVIIVHASVIISTQVHHSQNTSDTQEQGNDAKIQPERSMNHTSGKTYSAHHKYMYVYIRLIWGYTWLGLAFAGSKRRRCGWCTGCNTDDCGVCQYCQDKPKFGGPGKKKQCCEKRKCLNMKTEVHCPLLCSCVYMHMSHYIYTHVSHFCHNTCADCVYICTQARSTTSSSKQTSSSPLVNITNCIETIKTVADKTRKYMYLYVDVHV